MAIYYVKNGGNDSLNGLSDANAWATLARAAQAPLTGGDSVLFKCGSRWREEVTFFQKSGTSSSSRVTYGSYGTGTKPIIDGSDIVAGWTAETSGGSSGGGENFTDASGSRPVAWWMFSETAGNRASTAGGGNSLVPSASAPARGTGPQGQFAVEFVKANSQQLNLPESGMSTNFPGRSTLANGSLTFGGWVRVDGETGGDGGIMGKDTGYQLIIEGSVVQFRVFSSGNAAAVSSGEGVTYSGGTWRHYVCRYTVGTGETVLFVNGAKKTAATIATRNVFTGDFVVGNATFKSNFDGAVAELFMFDVALTDAQIASIYNTGLDGTRTSSGPTLYWRAFSSRPGAVFSDGNPLRLVQSKVDLAPGFEWWDATNLREYIRLPGDENPSAHTIEVALRTYPLRIQGANYWTAQDLWVRGAMKANIFADTSNDAAVQRCTLSHASENGLHIYTHTNLSTYGFDVSNNLCYNNGACGITVAGNFATSMAGIRIHHNETYANCWQPVQKESNNQAYTGGIRPIGREINDCIVEDNYVHDEGYLPDSDLSHGCGIWWDTTGANCICRRNRIERSTSWGIQLEDVNTHLVHSNLIIGTVHLPGIAIIRNCDNNKVYNNTIIDCNGAFNPSNGGGSHFVGNQIYNNIVSISKGWIIRADNGVSNVSNVAFNKNVIGPNRTNFILQDGTQYSTIASWESVFGGTSNSISSNATFVSPSTGDYHLATGSVGRNAGVAIPAGTLDFALNPFNASAPTIGALEVTSTNTYSGNSSVRLSILRTTAAGNRTLPGLTIASAVRLPILRTSAIATRTIPGQTIASAVSLFRPVVAALGSVSSPTTITGSSSPRLRVPVVSTLGQRTVPIRTVTSAVTLIKPIFGGLGTIGATTNRVLTSAVKLPIARTVSAGNRAIPSRDLTSAVTLRKITLAALGTLGASNAVLAAGAVRLRILRIAAAGNRTIPAQAIGSAVRLPTVRVATAGVMVLPGGWAIVPHVNAPAWRTADFGDGTTRVAWASPLDPGEKKAYTINCSRELTGVDLRIESVIILMSGLASLSGLRIRAVSNDNTNITLWMEIDPADKNRSNWSGAGEIHTLTITVYVTDGQRFERDVSLTVRQLGQT